MNKEFFEEISLAISLAETQDEIAIIFSKIALANEEVAKENQKIREMNFWLLKAKQIYNERMEEIQPKKDVKADDAETKAAKELSGLEK